MRKLLATSLVSALLVPLSVTTPATAHPTGQEVLETVFAPPLLAKNVSRTGRSFVLLGQMLGFNGIGGYYFAPDPDTIGAPFTLKPAGAKDVDVFFYSDLGDLVSAPASITGQYSNEDANGEKGFVPADTKWVVIYYGPCVPACAGPTNPPVSASFLYSAQEAPVLTLDGSEDLGRVEVHQGGQLIVNNATEAPVSLRSDALLGDGETPVILIEDITGKLMLDTAQIPLGDYSFTTSDGSIGTIAVLA